MWFKEYRDYETDKPLIQEPVESGKGIIGCEMHDLNGWGSLVHLPVKPKEGIISKILYTLFATKKTKGS